MCLCLFVCFCVCVRVCTYTRGRAFMYVRMNICTHAMYIYLCTLEIHARDYSRNSVQFPFCLYMDCYKWSWIRRDTWIIDKHNFVVTKLLIKIIFWLGTMHLCCQKRKQCVTPVRFSNEFWSQLHRCPRCAINHLLQDCFVDFKMCSSNAILSLRSFPFRR